MGRLRAKFKKINYFSLMTFLVIFGISGAALINTVILGDWFKISMAFVALILYFVPFFVAKVFKIGLPVLLEVFYYLFIFASLILGEVFAFYGPFLWWDVVLHFLSGFVFTGIGFALLKILNKERKISKPVTMIFAFCFSVTIGVLWECVEFSFDCLARTDAQKDAHVRQISTITLQHDGGNRPVRLDDITSVDIYLENGETVTINEGFLDIGLMDTMKDILVNFAGAALFLIMWPLIIKYWNFNNLGTNSGR